MKRVLVCGASGNVGAACLRIFGDWRVVGVSRSGPIHLDLRDRSQVREFLWSYSPFDLVIMSQGVQRPCHLRNLADDLYSEILEGNLLTSVILTQELLAEDRIHRGGMIIYFSSIQASNPRPGRGAYAIAKAGVEALCRVVAVEAGSIRAVCLRLGQLQEQMKNVIISPEKLRELEGRSLLPWPSAEDIALLCRSLYESFPATGVILDVEGGHRLNIWP